MNWLDIVILLVLLFYAFEGFEIGFIAGVLDLLSFVGSFFLGLKLYGVVAEFLQQYLSLPHGLAEAAGFFVIAVVVEVILSFILRGVIGANYDRFVRSIETDITLHNIAISRVVLININKVLGIVPGLLSAYVILSFLLTVVVALPFSPFLKQSISTSRFGDTMISGVQYLEGSLNKTFGQTISDTLNFLTVRPQSNETIALGFTVTKVLENEKAEEEMLALVNAEREKASLKPLAANEKLRDVARAHCKDMFAEGYFSHYAPGNISPFDRMANFEVSFNAAGENLALAPNPRIAMQGLMQSEGHKKNILSSSFGKLGIGAIDGGIYGIMFCQEFTD